MPEPDEPRGGQSPAPPGAFDAAPESFRLGPLRLRRPTLLLLLGAVVGLVVGLVTVGYRAAVLWGNQLLWHESLRAEVWTPGIVLARLLTPAAGGLLVGWLIYRRMTHRPNHGMPSVISAVQRDRVRLRLRDAIPSLSSVIILSSGGSAGPEGPVAEIGSIFGAKIGQLCRVHRRTYRTLVAAGVAAGISAVFNAPIAGVFFALEVVLQQYELNTFAPVVLASVVAAVVSTAAFGHDPALTVPAFSLSGWDLPLHALLGALMGLLSAGLIRFMSAAADVGRRMRLPLWLRPAVGGLGAGLVGLILPQVAGEGYVEVNRVLAGEVGLGLAAVLVAGKMLATGCTLGSGAPGGSFAPSVFIGCCAGSAFGQAAGALFPGYVGQPFSFGLTGIAGIVAGAFNAPVTAILLCLREAGGNYAMLLPTMLSVALATTVMGRWGHVSLYTQILKRSGEWEHPGTVRDPLHGWCVDDVATASVARMSEHETVQHALERTEAEREAAILVIGREGAFVGLVTLEDMRTALADPLLGQLVTLGDVVPRDVPGLTPDTPLREAMTRFAETRREVLPVLLPDRPEQILGIVTRAAIVEAYRKARALQQEGL